MKNRLTDAELMELAAKDDLVAAIVRQRVADVEEWIAAARRRWPWFFDRRGYTVTPK